jgi:selenide,water dikinase
MAVASGVSLAIRADAVPVFDGVLDIVAENRSGGLTTNEHHFGGAVRVHPGPPVGLEWVLFDPQTSGGLLVAVAGEHASEVEATLDAAGVRAWSIGRVQTAVGGVRVEVVV